MTEGDNRMGVESSSVAWIGLVQTHEDRKQTEPSSSGKTEGLEEMELAHHQQHDASWPARWQRMIIQLSRAKPCPDRPAGQVRLRLDISLHPQGLGSYLVIL